MGRKNNDFVYVRTSNVYARRVTNSSHYTFAAKTYPPLSRSTNSTRTHFVSKMSTKIEAKLQHKIENGCKRE